MEPDFAFDVSSIRTAAIKTRDGYRLSGMKGLVPLAANCSHFIVVAQCDGALDAFIVEREREGSERWREEAEHRTARARDGDRQFQRG